MSPTDCCDETRRLSIARRFGSAMISKTDSTLLVYAAGHIRVKGYNGWRLHGGVKSNVELPHFGPSRHVDTQIGGGAEINLTRQ